MASDLTPPPRVARHLPCEVEGVPRSGEGVILLDAIVLAAGSSTRFGSDKRVYSMNGANMLQHSIAAVRHAVRNVLVVLKASDRAHVLSLLGQYAEDANVVPIFLASPQCGMGSNLACAVAQLPKDTAAVLVMLADMPYVLPATVMAIVDAYQPATIVAPYYRANDGADLQRGHPVLFARHFFAELSALQGDNGARAVLHAHPEKLVQLCVQDNGILHDVDTRAAVM